MTEPTLIGLFVTPLIRLNIPYMVTGAVATAVYGEPRLTRDVDLVVALRPADSDRFAAAWPEAGFYVPPVEAIAEEARRPSAGHFNLSHHDTALRADVYLAGEDEFSHWALERAEIHEVERQQIRFAPVEYVIVNKLRYFQLGGSDRHLRDVAGILSVSANSVDHDEVERWARVLSVTREWRKARARGLGE